ncbi:GntR family transcriptional regulator [Ruania zhangjianzhongii]|uniref:GntR family transcriptional regulator n=1 Tax=Ruania zhangjianzhongii TaxID=2603206 RepID=UPI0011C89EF5|nr:GntR family transcriptional regulator [Ruania zhangjianzhongii]
MDIVIADRSNVPIYAQIHLQIASQILDGRLSPEQLLPSIRAIARELGISVITIKKAWELLEADDLIYTRPGKGSFVTAHPTDSLSVKRTSLAVERFRQEAPYYRSLALTTDELLAIVRQEY